MGFLHENITLAYFFLLLETARQLCPVALFQNFLLSLDICWAFSVGQEGHTSCFNLLVAFRRPNIGREHSLAFFIEFDTYLTTVILTKILELVYVKYVCSKIDPF